MSAQRLGYGDFVYKLDGKLSKMEANEQIGETSVGFGEY